MTNSEAYSNLEKVIKLMETQKLDQGMIDSVKMGRNALLAFEMIAIAANNKQA
jgi:hypothetical protein